MVGTVNLLPGIMNEYRFKASGSFDPMKTTQLLGGVIGSPERPLFNQAPLNS